jgi:hypothetical protein
MNTLKILKLKYSEFRGSLTLCLKQIDSKIFLKSILLMTAIYTLGIVSILRANFNYIDDINRAISGHRGWCNFGRHISQCLSVFLHTHVFLTDISPLPQLIAALIMAVSSILLVYVLCNKKITTGTLLASIPLGLSPFFLQCFSYKFDAPYMALSVFFSIIPFIFIDSTIVFAVVSIISLLCMCMSYQASSGIYISITIAIVFRNWNYKEKTNREILKFLLITAGAFVIAMFLFYGIFALKKAGTDWYVQVNTCIVPLTSLFHRVLAAIKQYSATIYGDMSYIWKCLIALICSCFVFLTVFTSKRNKLFALLLSALSLISAFVLLRGACLVLSNQHLAPRSLHVFGAFIAIVAISVASYKKFIATLFVFALSWCFFVFSLTYGNALADQKRYTEFRNGILFKDLNNLLPNMNADEFKIQIEGFTGFAPTITSNIEKRYPVVKRLLSEYVMHIDWSARYLLNYYNWGNFDMTHHSTNFMDLNLPIICDSYYHTIRYKDNKILVLLKH